MAGTSNNTGSTLFNYMTFSPQSQLTTYAITGAGTAMHLTGLQICLLLLICL